MDQPYIHRACINKKYQYQKKKHVVRVSDLFFTYETHIKWMVNVWLMYGDFFENVWQRSFAVWYPKYSTVFCIKKLFAQIRLKAGFFEQLQDGLKLLQMRLLRLPLSL